MAKPLTVQSDDSAGGPLICGTQTKMRYRGKLFAVVGDPVTPHAPFVPLHTAPVMAQGTSKFRIQGIPVCHEGHVANCGHPATGRPKFRIPD